ncbi:hypothetical protein LL941_10245 [Levilactobacillus brevis]|uniref:hypothetical protein n=1 Tax=Levilactobacillus brevis TaxID=1580 RepID=UPI001F2ECCE5|nr:hypothetical protein [Levilactobacillus brevis]MCE6013868.1 hypothetical protein [Levilactobacillus brevis]MCE6016217.1 hypothetical protein [Levilactobacillus brevis]
MGKDLLRKSLNADVTQVPKPNNIFSRNMTVKPATKKAKRKTTTIRCSVETADMVNALAAVLNFKSVDEMLEHTINNTLDGLTNDERTEYKTVKRIYTNRRNK